MKQNRKVKNLCITAMMAALVCVTTLIIQIPLPLGGYLNFGDCFMLTAVWLLGKRYGAAAGAVGGMLADLFSFAVYAPATLIIKALAAFAAGFLAEKLHDRHKTVAYVLSAAVSAVIIAVGYYLYEAAVIGYGFVAAAAGVPLNLLQGVVSGAAALVLSALLRKTGVHS